MARAKTISGIRNATTAESRRTNFISLATIWSLVLVAVARRFLVIAYIKATSEFFARRSRTPLDIARRVPVSLPVALLFFRGP